MTTHPHIDRLAALNVQLLGVRDIAHVLGKGERYALALVQSGKISSMQESAGAGDGKGKHKSTIRRYEVTNAAVLLYILGITVGDKSDVLAAVKLRFPEHYELCAAAASATAPAAPLPPGVIDARATFAASRRSKGKPALHLDPGPFLPGFSPAPTTATA